MDYDNTNTGATFKNDKKVEVWMEFLAGGFDVEGTYVSKNKGWSPPQNGKKGYFRHKVKRKQPKQESAHASAPVASTDPVDDPFSSDVPW